MCLEIEVLQKILRKKNEPKIDILISSKIRAVSEEITAETALILSFENFRFQRFSELNQRYS